MAARAVVVKVGGSLFELPDLGPRLRRFLTGLANRAVLVVPGGGRAADVVRVLDQVHGLGEEASHWLALRGLTLNAYFLATLLTPAPVIPDPASWLCRAEAGSVAIIDGYAFALHDEHHDPGQALPHQWSATSDSLAVRIACAVGADRLVLLKSVTIPRGTAWILAARHGWVDGLFAGMIDRAGTSLAVEAVNLREGVPECF